MPLSGGGDDAAGRRYTLQAEDRTTLRERHTGRGEAFRRRFGVVYYPNVWIESPLATYGFRLGPDGTVSARLSAAPDSVMQDVVRGPATRAERLAEAPEGCQAIMLEGSVPLKVSVH